MKKNVLLTGAGGRIGTAFRSYVGDRYALRLVDANPERLGEAGDFETVSANLADLAAAQEVCEGMDTVVHLAADPSPRADFYASLLENNIKAMYNVFRAAKDQGCRRVIFASSITVIDGYPSDVQAHPSLPIRPLNMYAAAKAFGEATAHAFAYGEGLSCIAIRIGAFEGNRSIENPDASALSSFVSKRDLSHLIERCIEAPDDVQFAIVQAVSDNRFKRMDITSAREIVGYAPQDDAFEIFNSGLHYRDRWLEEYDRRSRIRNGR